MLHVLNVEDIEDTYSSSVYLIQKEEKDDDDNDWVQHVLDPQHRQKQKKPFLVVSMSKIQLLILVFTVQCTEFMLKTSKIFKCICIYFRRMIQTKTRLGFSWGQILAWRLWKMRRLRLRWIKLRRTRRWPGCTKMPKSVTGK